MARVFIEEVGSAAFQPVGRIDWAERLAHVMRAIVNDLHALVRLEVVDADRARRLFDASSLVREIHKPSAPTCRELYLAL